jgi:hypothetical protein
MTEHDAHPSAAPHAPSAYALLGLGETRLVIPRSEIRVLEPALDVDQAAAPLQGVGWIGFESSRCPVYCWSDALHPLPASPPDRPVCAVLSAAGCNFGLLCSEAVLLRADELALHELPAAMWAPGQAFNRLAIWRGRIACVSSAAAILAALRATHPADLLTHEVWA